MRLKYLYFPIRYYFLKGGSWLNTKNTQYGDIAEDHKTSTTDIMNIIRGNRFMLII